MAGLLLCVSLCVCECVCECISNHPTNQADQQGQPYEEVFLAEEEGVGVEERWMKGEEEMWGSIVRVYVLCTYCRWV